MTDPVFEAIERQRRAWAAFEAASEKGPEYDRLLLEEEAAREALEATAPLTLAGLRASLEWLAEEEERFGGSVVAHLRSLLRSPALPNATGESGAKPRI
jgi:hypothetical protein